MPRRNWCLTRALPCITRESRRSISTSSAKAEVALRGVSGGVTLHVDDVMPGEIFGTCLCSGRNTYALEAQCEVKTTLMRVRADVFSRILHNDPILGYAVQAYISGVYFRRYLDAITKLQTVVQSLPLARI